MKKLVVVNSTTLHKCPKSVKCKKNDRVCGRNRKDIRRISAAADERNSVSHIYTLLMRSQSMCLSFAFGLSYTLSLQSALAPIYIRGQFNLITIIIVTGISLVSRYHRHKCVLVSYEKKNSFTYNETVSRAHKDFSVAAAANFCC